MRRLLLRAAAAACCLHGLAFTAFAELPISSTIGDATGGAPTFVSASALTDSVDAAIVDARDSTASASDCGSLSDCCVCCPIWTIYAGAAFLERSSPAALPLVVPTAGPGQIAGGGDFNFGATAGPDVGIARRLASGNSIEMRYFGALNWTDIQPYGAVGNVRIGSFSNFGATDLFARYASRLNSTEVNWLGPISDRITVVGGFRAIALHDVLNYHITFPAFTADYNWNVDNHLYGGQIGTYLALWNLDGPFTVNAGLKAGAYSNLADNDFFLRPSTGGLFTGGRSIQRPAFVGDVNVTAAYQLTNHIALRGGYQLLWLEHVALASDQLAASTAASTQAVINYHGHAFYHGALAGLVVTW